jgi:hypothetical protein
MARKPQAKFAARQSRDQTRWAERSVGTRRIVRPYGERRWPLHHALNSCGLAQNKAHAFGRQPIPIADARIIGLGIRQAEFGLVKKQRRGLQGLEASGLERLAAVVRALATAAGLSRKNTGLLGATG